MIDDHPTFTERQVHDVGKPVRLDAGGPDHCVGLDPLSASECDSVGIGGIYLLAQAHVDTTAAEVSEGSLRRVRVKGAEQSRSRFNENHPQLGDRSDDLLGHRGQRRGGLDSGWTSAHDHGRDLRINGGASTRNLFKGGKEVG